MPEHLGSLELLRRQYLQLIPSDLMILPCSRTLVAPENQSFIFERMFNLHTIDHPPPDRYRLRVLKKIIAHIEEGLQDPDQDV